jgi:hypothetical protein
MKTPCGYGETARTRFGAKNNVFSMGKKQCFLRNLTFCHILGVLGISRRSGPPVTSEA